MIAVIYSIVRINQAVSIKILPRKPDDNKGGGSEDDKNAERASGRD